MLARRASSGSAVARTATEPDPVMVVLRELVAEVRGLRADLVRDRRPSYLTRAERDRLTRILPAIKGAFGSEPFTSRDLYTKPSPRVVLTDLSVKQIGKLLARAEGIPINGLVVERYSIEINVTLWRVLAC